MVPERSSCDCPVNVLIKLFSMAKRTACSCARARTVATLCPPETATAPRRCYYKSSDLSWLHFAIHNDAGNKSPALLPVGSSCVLDYWLGCLQSCPWLQPMQQKLFIVCDNGQQAAFQAWAQRSAQAHQAGFIGGSQILPAPLGSTAAVNQTAALTAFAAVQHLADMLIVIDGTSLCEPGFSLQRFIQHAVVRNKDAVGFCTWASQQGSQQVQLQLDGDAINPRVTSVVQPDANSTAAVGVAAYLAPVFAFTAASVPRLMQTGELSLSAALQHLLECEQVYALPVQCAFAVGSLDGYLYADAFFTFYQQRWKLLHGQAAAAQAMQPQAWTGSDRLSAAVAPIHAALAEFDQTYAATMIAEAHARYIQGKSGVLGMPERFTDASLWRWRRKYEHPVYMTSNNAYGAKAPSQQMLPPSWHGVKGEFTKNYIKNEVRTGNFSTGLPSSRVHSALTELC